MKKDLLNFFNRSENGQFVLSVSRNWMYSSSTLLLRLYLTFLPSFSERMISVSVNCLRWCAIEGCARSIMLPRSTQYRQSFCFFISLRIIMRLESDSAFAIFSAFLEFIADMLKVTKVQIWLRYRKPGRIHRLSIFISTFAD